MIFFKKELKLLCKPAGERVKVTKIFQILPIIPTFDLLLFSSLKAK